MLGWPRRGEPLMAKARSPFRFWVSPTLATMLLAFCISSIAVGPVPLAQGQFPAGLLGTGPKAHPVIVREIRLPRAILSLPIDQGRAVARGAPNEALAYVALVETDGVTALRQETAVEMALSPSGRWQ